MGCQPPESGLRNIEITEDLGTMECKERYVHGCDQRSFWRSANFTGAVLRARDRKKDKRIVSRLNYCIKDHNSGKKDSNYALILRLSLHRGHRYHHATL